jgi:transposase
MVQMVPELSNIVKYLSQVKKNHGDDCEFLCGYEAGSLGYALYHQLTGCGYNCVILAPTTMADTNNRRVKTDKRDAINIAKNLAYRTYKPVHIPTVEDNAVKEYIRLRDDAKDILKKIKQQILAFCLRHGKRFDEGKSYWTRKHLEWLVKQEYGNAILQETYQEYLALYRQASDKVTLFDQRIEELANQERYVQKVQMLSCLIGIKTHTALATIVETGDFNRFKNARCYAAYLGLVPGENSSGGTVRRTGITKAGNAHIRKLLVEAAQSYSRSSVGKKSKALLARQLGNDPKVIAYADRANERLKRKFYKMTCRNVKRNIAITAVAREISCFIWGMMTGNDA